MMFWLKQLRTQIDNMAEIKNDFMVNENQTMINEERN